MQTRLMAKQIAADQATIAALRTKNAELRKALEPFARAADFYEIERHANAETQMLVRQGEGTDSALKVKDFRAARSALIAE